jgi:transcriptional regulator with XRE-family HTH domain
MSPRSFRWTPPSSVAAAVRRLFVLVGAEVREARRARRWSMRVLAERANVSVALVHLVESGEPASVEAIVRLTAALGRRLEWTAIDPRARVGPPRTFGSDVVHSAMGEFEAKRLHRPGIAVGIDEPYQHYQFAGRADVVAWDLEQRAFLHSENKTRARDLQELAGAYNSKRAYLGAALAERLGIRRWATETHVIAMLWSSEVLHVVRHREATFRALCPDDLAGFSAWWSGTRPSPGVTSALIVLDPLATGRQAPYVDLERGVIAKARHRGYAEVAARLDQAA